jgi:hypothetical protein
MSKGRRARHPQETERQVLFTESRPLRLGVLRYLLPATFGFLILGMGAALIPIISGVLSSLRAAMSGVAAPELLDRLRDLVLPVLVMAGVGFVFYFRIRQQWRIGASLMIIQLDHRQLTVRLTAIAPLVTFPRGEIADLSGAEYNWVVEAAKLDQTDVARSEILAAALQPARGLHQRGVRITLRSGEVLHLGLIDQAAFLVAWAQPQPSVGAPR